MLLSLFKNAFGKHSMPNDKAMYLTATRQGRGNGACVYVEVSKIFFTFKIMFFLSRVLFI